MIKSINKAIEILELLKKYPEGLSLVEICTLLNIPKTTAFGLLKTLTTSLYLLKDEKSTYKLGPALISLGQVASLGMNIQKIIYPILEDLSLKIGVDSFLMVPIGYKGTVIERVNGKESVRVIERFGNEFYLHCGATRKAILANKSDKFIKSYIKDVIEKENAQIKSSDLINTLNKIKKEGVAISFGDYAKGTIGVGAPLYNYKGEVIASIGINLLENDKITEEKINEIKNIVKLKAEEGTKKLEILSINTIKY